MRQFRFMRDVLAVWHHTRSTKLHISNWWLNCVSLVYQDYKMTMYSNKVLQGQRTGKVQRKYIAVILDSSGNSCLTGYKVVIDDS